MTDRVPFMIISPNFAKRKLKRLRGISKKITDKIPSIEKKLNAAELDIKPEVFLIAAFFSAVLIGTLMFGLIYFVSSTKGDEISRVLYLASMSGGGFSFLMLLIYLQYPSMIASRIAGDINKHLMFALKDLLLHTLSGVSLYDGLISVSKADYGKISEEFKNVAKAIHSGMATDKALQDLADRTESEYLKKVLWQLINSLRAGSNVKSSLETIVTDLTHSQRASIMSYANELNLWSLIYMLFAVAAPTIGLTMMIILSSFADIGVNEASLILFICVTAFIQIIIIGLIKSRRPMVDF